MTASTDVPDGYVLVKIEDFNQLKDDSAKLNSLINGGVDNWEWYYESLAGYREWRGEDPDD